MKKYVCTICSYIYDETVGIPENNIAPGTKWDDLPQDWACPLCGAAKADFQEQQTSTITTSPTSPTFTVTEEGSHEMPEMSFGEMSALCSNLAKGCEKQYLAEEAELFNKLADYYKSKIVHPNEDQLEDLMTLIQHNLNQSYPQVNYVAKANADRGALRALVWSEKVTRMLNSLLNRYAKEGNAFLENTNVYVCEICGFLYVGDETPEICPVCKVPKIKITKVERR